jgi:hypothetical protein
VLQPDSSADEASAKAIMVSESSRFMVRFS